MPDLTEAQRERLAEHEIMNSRHGEVACYCRSDWMTHAEYAEHMRAVVAAIADEAAAGALAGHRCQVGGDGWSAARGRGSVGGDQ